MVHLFTDASFDWHHTEKTKESFVRGKIAVVGEGLVVVDKVAVGKVPGLKQYTNILELTAIARAIELAITNKFEKNLKISTDSMVAMYWASSGKIKDSVRTKAHQEALDYLRNMKKQFNGIVTFYHTGRDKNPAGHKLEEELKKEKSYAK